MSGESVSGIDPRDVLEGQYGSLSHLGGPQTPIRVAVLAELDANGSLTRRGLRDIFVDGDGGWEFEVSKPTLYRQFDEDTGSGAEDSLVERGWIRDISETEGAESRYALTPKGRIVYEEMTSLFDAFELVEEVPSDLEPFLEVVNKSEMRMEKEVLEELSEVEIYSIKSTNVFGMSTYQEYIEFISEADRICGITWVWSEMFLDSYYEFLVEEDIEVEFILTSEVIETLIEDYAEEWREMLETGNLEVFECDVYPFGVTIVEYGVAWGYFEPEKGTHEYELITESDAVQEWAAGVFEEFKQKGRRVTEEQLERTEG